MKTARRLLITALSAAALFMFIVFPVSAASSDYVPGEVIVKFRPGTSQTQMDEANRHAKGHETKHVNGARKIDLDDPSSVASALIAYSNDPAVEYAEPNYVYKALVTTPNDTYYSVYQWNLRIIGADVAWDTWRGKNTVLIAIVDTGVSPTHPDLAGKMVAGYDFINKDNDPADENGHGTHVAGIAAAISNNGTGVAGVDWNAKIMPVRVLDATGSGSSLNVANGITWAADNGAKVINLSLGDPAYSQTVQSAINYAYAKGVVVVAAAGNSGSSGNPVMYPGAGEHVISVAATDSADNRAGFSEFNQFVDVAAPGVSIASTYWNTNPANGPLGDIYVGMTGTSMASPHVAGLVSLLIGLHPNWTPDQIEQRIKDTATDLGAPGRDDYYGAGRINAGAAVANSAVILSGVFNGQVLTTQFPRFSWTPANFATGYGIELLSAPPVLSEQNSMYASSYRLGVGVTGATAWTGDIRGMPAKTYWYRVIAWNSGGFVANFSNADSFVVPKPQLNAVDWSRGNSNPTFSWSVPADPTAPVLNSGIELLSGPLAPGEENNTAASTKRIAVGILSGTQWIGDTTNLIRGHTYYYRIISWNRYGFVGGFSDADSFTVR